MDEYTFIVLAKLKADRLKLEREQRVDRRADSPAEVEPIDRYRRSPRTARAVHELNWREQS